MNTPGANMVQTRIYLASVQERLPMFVVTDHPADQPDFYVARLHLTVPEDVTMPLAFVDRDLGRLRDTMEALGLVCLTRSPEDDPVIVETWL